MINCRSNVAEVYDQRINYELRCFSKIVNNHFVIINRNNIEMYFHAIQTNPIWKFIKIL